MSNARRVFIVDSNDEIESQLLTNGVTIANSCLKDAFAKIVDFAPDLILINRMDCSHDDSKLPVILNLHYAALNIALPNIFILGKDKSVIDEVESRFCSFCFLNSINRKDINFQENDS